MKWYIRAIRTFVQTAIGYICVALPAIDWSGDRSALKATLIGIGVSAVSGGLAAVINLYDEGAGKNDR